MSLSKMSAVGLTSSEKDLMPYWNSSCLDMSQKSLSHTETSTARNMMTFAHYRFKQYLKARGQQAMCEVIEVSEAYTSKTCSYCGKIHKIGSKKVINRVEAGLRLQCGCRSRFERCTGNFPACFGGYALIDPPKNQSASVETEE